MSAILLGRAIALTVTTAAVLATPFLTACSSGRSAEEQRSQTAVTTGTTETTEQSHGYVIMQQAKSINQSRHVAARFDDQPVVLDDPFGFEASTLFFDSSEVLVVADDTPAAQLRAASVAVVAHAPLVIYHRDHHAKVIQEIERLGAHRVFAVGDVPVLGYSDRIKVVKDPGGVEALEKATALKFGTRQVAAEEEAAAAIADLDPATPECLEATYGPDLVIAGGAQGGTVLLQSRLDAEMAPQIIATPLSPLAGVATARAYGASVFVVDGPDPRESTETFLVTTGLADKPLVAVGKQFGTGEELSARIREAEAAARPEDFERIENIPQSVR